MTKYHENQRFSFENQENTENQTSVKIFNAIKEKLNNTNGQNNESSLGNFSTNFGSSQSGCFDTRIKLDIYKTMYDYFYFTILNKYFVFYFDVKDACNLKELQM